MENKNEVAKKKEHGVEYMVAGEKITLTPSTVVKYLVNGSKESVTMEEIVVFMNICRYNKLNPWLREAYCVKYGSAPATMVIGKEAYLKLAESNPEYNGSEAGIIVITEVGDLERRTGTFKAPNETIVGGWAEVWRKDRDHSTKIEVSMDEYVGKKKDGSVNGQWASKPATMIRKVALVQALREAFPSHLGGIYSEEEQNVPETKDAPVVSADPFVKIEKKDEPVMEAKPVEAETAESAPEELPFK